MSLAFLLFCLWLIPAIASPAMPTLWRGMARLGLFGLGVLIALMALLTGGWLPGAFALIGVLAVIPEPVQIIVARARLRIRPPRRAPAA